MEEFDISDQKINLLGAHLLEASAGTGKTFAIERLTSDLVLKYHFKLEEILIVTFTRLATRELKQRIATRLQIDTNCHGDKATMLQWPQSEIFTIHGFCYNMLTKFREAEHLNIAHKSDGEDGYSLKSYIADLLHTKLTHANYSTSQIEMLLSAHKNDVYELIDQIITLLEKEEWLPLLPTFEECVGAYNSARSTLHFPTHLLDHFTKIRTRDGELKEQYVPQISLLEKNQLSAAEFDSLIAFPQLLQILDKKNLSKKSEGADLNQLFGFKNILFPIIRSARCHTCNLIRLTKQIAPEVKHFPLLLMPQEILRTMWKALDSISFCQKVKSRYRVLIVDEFQDTDPLQWQILKKLFFEHKTEAIYLVGDPKQSIYGFRSADLRVYAEARQLVDSTMSIKTNHRSAPQLVAMLNKLFSTCSFSSSKFQIQYLPSKPKAECICREFHDGKDPVHFFVYDSCGHSRSQIYIETNLFFPFISEEILRLLKAGCTLSDFAVIIKDKHQANRLKVFLHSNGIQTTVKNPLLLRDSTVFSSIYSLIEALVERSESATIRFLAHTHSHNMLKNTGFVREKMALIRSLANNIPKALFSLYKPRNQQENNDFIAITEHLISYYISHDRSLHSLLDLLRSRPKWESIIDNEANAVTLITPHKSKGLEFNIVFALGMVYRSPERESLVKYNGKWTAAWLAEQCKVALHERNAEKIRLLYVSATRAKYRVYLPIISGDGGGNSPIDILSPDISGQNAIGTKTLLTCNT